MHILEPIQRYTLKIALQAVFGNLSLAKIERCYFDKNQLHEGMMVGGNFSGFLKGES